ncbi:protein angel homolog 2 isoform X2 [Hyperolius riggenbachi]|uniref:protein angel homolog 2 isoform X2 n=1 Tax=Hyperolius riggenbachi TaxID=752182 RepID=UPI0035A3B2F1
MLPRHLQSVGSRYIARAGHPCFSCTSRDFSRCPWWTAHCPQTLYPPISGWRPREYGRPYPFISNQRPALLEPPSFPWPSLLPWIPSQSSWLHTSGYNMDSTGDEPYRKRRKSQEGDGQGKKLWPKRSYPPSSDFSVPSTTDTSGLPVPASTQPVVKARRKWEDFSHLYSNSSGIRWARRWFDFSVMSYNILSQDLLEDNSSLYDHCRRPLLFWNYRLPNILRELREFNADILCLQEVQEDHYQQQIKPSLEALGYSCEYKSRTGSKPDGCAICFKSDKFSLVLAKPVEYFRRNIALLDRDNVGLVLMLQPKTWKEATAICVANTHLLYNPRRGDIKLAQLAILLAEITRVAQVQDGKFCPIILCGDFNSVPGSPLHKFIKEGSLDYEGMTIGKVSGQEQSYRGQRILSIPIWPKSLGITQQCVYESREEKREEGELKEAARKQMEAQREEVSKGDESSLQHHFCLSSVYSHVFPDTGMPEITTCHSKSAITVDYIFYSAARNDVFSQPGGAVHCNGLQLLGRLSLLTERDLWSVNGLPNETNSSDHLSLLARFRLEL